MIQKFKCAINAMEGMGEFKKELSSLISKYSAEARRNMGNYIP